LHFTKIIPTARFIQWNAFIFNILRQNEAGGIFQKKVLFFRLNRKKFSGKKMGKIRTLKIDVASVYLSENLFLKF